MTKRFRYFLIVMFMISMTTAFSQEKTSKANKIYQIKKLLDDKFLDVKIKEYFVFEIRKTELVKPIDNHEFVHFYLDRFNLKYKPLIKKELSKYKTTITQQQGMMLVNEIIAKMANDFNVYRLANPILEDKNTIFDVNLFKLGSGLGAETEGAGQPCNNSDFETGDCTGWEVITGTVPTIATVPFSFTQSGTSTCGVSPNHVIMTGGVDPNGGFPTVFPGSGGASLMIGDAMGTNNGAAKIRQTFLVDAGSAAFSYHYAVVLNDAGHAIVDQPYFKVNMFDASGNPIACSDYSVAAPTCAGTGSGCDPDFTAYSTNGGGFYSDWRTAFAPLQSYIGQNVTIEFLVGDCTAGAHYGYAYVDASCDPLAIIPSQTVICGGQPVTLTAPAGAISYAWTPGGQTTQTITTNVPGHYEVFVVPVTGSACGLTLTADIGGSPDYPIAKFSANPTNVCAGTPIAFTNSSYVVGTSAIDSVQWDFDSDGIVDNTALNPTYTYTSAGNYTATLLVFNNGCQDDTTINITITPGAKANFTAAPVCVGVPTSFLDTSTPLGTVAMWNWDFDNNGTIDNTTQNPTYTFASAGIFPVKLQVSGALGACPGDTTINVVVSPKPNADFTGTNQCLNTATTFVNNSTISSGTITGWSWNFADATALNTTQTPSHLYAASGTYNVTLITTSDNTCKDTANLIVKVYNNPVANFSTNIACENFATSFTDLSAQGDTTLNGWQWDFDNNTTIDNTTQNPTNTYLSDGSYPVSLIVTDGLGCKDSTSVNVIVAPKPTAAFTFTNVCFGATTGFTDLSTGNGGTINQWGWDFTNNGSVDATTQVLPLGYGYAAAGTNTAELLVTTTAGCKDSTTLVIAVDPVPLSNFSGTNVCFGSTTTFIDSSTIASGNITSWDWTFGDALSGTSVVPSPTYNYALPGNYVVTLKVNSDSGCTHTFIRNIQVYNNPVANFSTNIACENFATSFTDLSLQGDTIINGWQWDFDNNTTVDNTTQNPTNTYINDGSYPVSLIITDGHGCKDTTSVNVTVAPKPTAAFTFTNVCFGATTGFTDLSTGNGGTINQWAWDFTNNGSVDATTQVLPSGYGYASAGTNTAELLVTTAAGCKDSTTLVIVVDPVPLSNFSGTNVCFGNTTTFIDSSTIATGNIVSWDWNFGDALLGTSTAPSPTYNYALPGSYVVTLKVNSDSGCTHTFIRNIQVYGNPIANFSTGVACSSSATAFTDLTTIGNTAIQTWSWDYDNNGSTDASLQNPNYIFAGAGIYPVKLSVVDTFSCVHDTTLNVTVSENPIANFTYTNVCYGLGTVFTDLSNSNGGTTLIDTWEWDYDGNGTIDNSTPSPTYIFPSAGTYQTEFIVTSALGCKDTITIPVVVDPIPVASFTAADACLEYITTFINNSTVSTGSIINWAWNFGDASGTSTMTAPTYIYANAGTFYVSLTVTSDSGCTHNVIIPVTVNPKPTANFSVANVCLNVPAQFTDASVGNGATINQYSWDFTNNGSIDNTSQNTTNLYAADGTFNIGLIVSTTNNCKDTIVKPVTIYPMPNADFTFVNSCFMDSVVFTNNSNVTSGTINAWNWSFGDAQVSSLQNPAHNYGSEGVYNVKLIVTTNNNCKDTVVKNGIEVWPLPFVDFIPTTVCLNARTQYQNLSTVSNQYTVNNNVQWHWDFADGIGTSNDSLPVYTYLTEGIFNAMLTVTTNHNCVDSIIKPVTVRPLPVVDFVADTAGCSPDFRSTFINNTTLASGTFTNWNWDFNSDGFTDNSSQNPTGILFSNLSHSSVQNYSIRLIATSDFGCKDTLTKVNYIHVYPKPLASFTYWPNEVTIVDKEITFTDQSIIANTWDWELGDGTSTITPSPIHEYADTGFYLVTLRIENDYGCRDTTQKFVQVKPIYAIYIPNAFTPNGDFSNDYFFVNGYGIKELQMMIFDRWGAKLYDDIGVDQTWDGKYQGNIVPLDVYVYKVRAKDVFNEWHDYIGKVTVVR